MILAKEPISIELLGTELLVNAKHHAHTVRHLSSMKKLFIGEDFEKDWDLYYMYRNVFSANNIRYDITIIPSLRIGKEWVKTFGHYHPKANDGVEYPELYQVLRGNAVFILQKKRSDGGVDVLMVDAKEKDVILMPPGFGHVTVNRGSQTLILSNIVSNLFESDYSEYEQNKGAAVYLTDSVEYNPAYVVKTFNRITAPELNKSYGIGCKDILLELSKDPTLFEYLNVPHLKFKK